MASVVVYRTRDDHHVIASISSRPLIACFTRGLSNYTEADQGCFVDNHSDSRPPPSNDSTRKQRNLLAT